MDRFWSVREKRSLVAKLVVGFAALFLMVLLLGINAILVARDMNWQIAELYQRELLGISHLKEANIDLISAGRALQQMVLAPTFVDRDQARAQLHRAMLDLDKEIAAAYDSIFRDRERLLLNEFAQEFGHYKRNVDEAIRLIDRSTDYQGKATAYISGEQFNHVGDSADQLLRRMVSIKEEGARAAAAAMARHSRDMQRLTLQLLLGGLLFGTIVAILISRAIKQQPADHSRHAVARLAQGNVDVAMPAVGYRSELGAEQQCTAIEAWQAEPIHIEADAIVENASDGMPVMDDQRALILPERTSPEHISPEHLSSEYEHTAKICGEEFTAERFASLDGPHTAPIGRAAILVVEDNVSSQAVSIGMLANAGCNVAIANSGQQALALLEESPYDVVLVNMQTMMDGISATLEIRKNSAFDRLPIIAMTAAGTQQDRARCQAAGMDGHIATPIDPDELFRALMRWVSPAPQSAAGLAIIASAVRQRI